jgi:DNA excision repair protein ERCC-2
MSTENNPSDEPNKDSDDTAPSWREYFRYDTIYPDQHTGIDNFLEVLRDGGYYSLEGPCGTGKTLIAVTAAIEAMRSDDFPQYERTGVFTPNKQQLNQFIEEMRGVNRAMPPSIDPATTVVLKGRNDMLPFAYCDAPPFDEDSVTEHIDDLREKTRDIIQYGSDIPLDWPDGVTPQPFSKHDYDWSKPSSQATSMRDKHNGYDPRRAEAVKQILINKRKNDSDYEQLVVDGIASPYPDIVPHTRNIVNTSELENQGMNQLPLNLQGNFDPFYAGYFTESQPNFGFDDAPEYVFDRDVLFEKGVKRGVCPHELMAHFGQNASILLGNYMHVFDSQTRNLTDMKMGVLDDETIVVIDEAHRLGARVRDMLSSELDLYTLDKAIADLELMNAYIDGNFSQTPTNNLDSDTIRDIKQLCDDAIDEVSTITVTEADFERVETLFKFIKNKMYDIAGDYLNEQRTNWQRQLENDSIADEEVPLSSPEFPDAEDKLLNKITARFSDGDERMKKALGVFDAINIFFEKLEEEGYHKRDVQDIEIGEFCYDWIRSDGIEYHKQLKLDVSPKKQIPNDYPRYVEAYTPKFELYNCIPSEQLRAIFAELGGGILMSATLSPPEMFQQVVGVDSVPKETNDDKSNSTESIDDTDTRVAKFDQFDLRFPEENRASIIGDLPKFDYSNRGPMATNLDDMSSTRRQYVDSLSEICSSFGNILVCMPKYAEAEWAYNVLEKTLDKDVFLDTSSSNAETNELLDQFFNSDGHGVIFTSTRGTITEGVDYDGNKLHCCVVVGIPLINTQPERVEAVKRAYSKKVQGYRGFTTAINIPAVRKARQAMGRVIRGNQEVGVRILLDERYGHSEWDGANEYLSEAEQEEFDVVDGDEIGDRLSVFWDKNKHKTEAYDEHKPTETNYENSTSPSSNNNSTTASSSSEESIADDSEPDEENNETTGQVEKLYIGDGGEASGWVPIELETIENEIAPIIKGATIEEEGSEEEGVKINATQATSISGWQTVSKAVVDKTLNDLVEKYRVDR